MSKLNSEPAQPTPVVVKEKDDTSVALAVVIAVAILTLACILSCTIVTVAFLYNAPWL
jgi:hypothetical protein